VIKVSAKTGAAKAAPSHANVTAQPVSTPAAAANTTPHTALNAAPVTPATPAATTPPAATNPATANSGSLPPILH